MNQFPPLWCLDRLQRRARRWFNLLILSDASRHCHQTVTPGYRHRWVGQRFQYRRRAKTRVHTGAGLCIVLKDGQVQSGELRAQRHLVLLTGNVPAEHHRRSWEE